MAQRLLSSTPFSLILRSITFNSQLYGFNSQLYTNLSVAREFPGGVVGVSIMLQVGTPISFTFDFFLLKAFSVFQSTQPKTTKISTKKSHTHIHVIDTDNYEIC